MTFQEKQHKNYLNASYKTPQIDKIQNSPKKHFMSRSVSARINRRVSDIRIIRSQKRTSIARTPNVVTSALRHDDTSLLLSNPNRGLVLHTFESAGQISCSVPSILFFRRPIHRSVQSHCPSSSCTLLRHQQAFVYHAWPGRI